MDLMNRTSGTPENKQNQSTDAESFYVFRILQALRQSIRAIDLHSRKLAAEHHITGPQLMCMRTLQEDGPMSISSLARSMHLSPSTVVGIVDRLEEKQLVSRTRDESDRRMVSVELTETGRKLTDKAPAPLQDMLSSALSHLPEAEQMIIVQSVEKVVDMIGARDMDAAPILETSYTLPMQPVSTDPVVSEQDVVKKSSEDKKRKYPLEIRRATQADKADIIRFINSSGEWYRSIVDEKDLAEHFVDEAWFEKNFDRREFYVGFWEGKPVGTVTLQFFGEYTYLGYVYTDVEHVGKGFGKQLLDFAAEESKNRGMKGMVLIAHPQATWAVRAYKKYGFKLEERDKERVLAWNNGALEPYYEEFFQLFIYPFQNKS